MDKRFLKGLIPFSIFSIAIVLGIIIGLLISSASNITSQIQAQGGGSLSTSAVGGVSNSNVDDLKKLSNAFVSVAKSTIPAVVSINAQRKVTSATRQYRFDFPRNNPFWGDDFFERFFENPPEFNSSSLGSGVIVSKDGYILTNNHVIQDANDIKVQLSDKREFDAKLIGSDSRSDLAVIKIEGKDLPVAKLGNSDELEIGEWVVAIGNPFGLSETVTAGIVSAKGRSKVVNPANYEDFIQTDAAINPGNSGGALVNLNGEVIGINTAIATRTGAYNGVGFAIPINSAKKVMTDLIEKGEVTRGWMGVRIQDLTSELADKLGLSKPEGALVGDVENNSPADKAGIKVGDVILEFDGVKIKDTDHLRNTVANTDVGKKVKVVVFRDGSKKELTLEVGKLPESVAETNVKKKDKNKSVVKLGLTVQELNSDLARSLGIEETSGLVITDVEPGTPAREAGLREGDVIKEINRTPVKTLSDYERIMNNVKPGDTVLFLVKQSGYTHFVIMKVPKG